MQLTAKLFGSAKIYICSKENYTCAWKKNIIGIAKIYTIYTKNTYPSKEEPERFRGKCQMPFLILL